MKCTSLCKRILIPLFLPYTLFTGCSVLGAVAGAKSDRSREVKTTSSLGLDSIDVGTPIRLVKYDRDTLEGSFNGIAVYPGKLYAFTYDTLVARSSFKGFVPKLNQRITLRSAGRADDGFFKGIDRGELLFQPVSESDTIAVFLDEIDWLQASDSLRLDGKTTRMLVRNGSMLGRRVVLLESRRAEELVPYETIENVEVLLPPSRSGLFKGFLAGAAVDIVLAVMLSNADCKSSSGCAPYHHY